MKLYWTYQAREDLKEIGHYIAEDNPQAARRWITRLRDRAKKIPDAPRAGRIVPEFMKENIREVIEQNYRIVYQIKENRIDILTVFESHRLIPLEKPSEKDN